MRAGSCGLRLLEEAATPARFGPRDHDDSCLVVLVRDTSRRLASDLRDLVLRHGGHEVRHYGRFTVASLAP